jgi:5-formyltetrahydrofolate cyclo-ligase
MPSQIEIEAEKHAIRSSARAVRNAVTAEQRARDAETIARHGLAFLPRTPGIVAAYHPVRGELDCMPLLRRLVGDGWTLALPVIVGAAPLAFREWHFGASLDPGLFGIPAPLAGRPAVPEVLLVPLLAFDRRGYRLGYGGGHYDRTLAALRGEGGAVAIGLAFDAQEVARVPVCPYDEPLDWILTPSGALSAKDSR